MKPYKSKFQEHIFPRHLKDELLRGITYEELADTVSANVKDVTEEAIKAEFEKILKMRIEDARAEIRDNKAVIDMIMEQVS